MDAEPKTVAKKLVIPAALAVVVLATGCTGTPQPATDAATDAHVADAGSFDAGCVPPYEQIDGTCQLLV